jgi:hypothetical protein
MRVFFSPAGLEISQSRKRNRIIPCAGLAHKLGCRAGAHQAKERSLNTYENAIESTRVGQPLAGETRLLFTSAGHMPRAVACFRAAGFDSPETRAK